MPGGAVCHPVLDDEGHVSGGRQKAVVGRCGRIHGLYPGFGEGLDHGCAA